MWDPLFNKTCSTAAALDLFHRGCLIFRRRLQVNRGNMGRFPSAARDNVMFVRSTFTATEAHRAATEIEDCMTYE